MRRAAAPDPFRTRSVRRRPGATGAAAAADGRPLSAPTREHISLLYNTLGEHRPAAGGCCSGSPRPARTPILRLFVELVVAAPPQDAQAAALADRAAVSTPALRPCRVVSRACSMRCNFRRLAAPVLDLCQLPVPHPPRHRNIRRCDRTGQNSSHCWATRAATVDAGRIARGHARESGSDSASGR